MRIIEPKKRVVVKKRRSKKPFMFAVVVLLVVAGVYYAYSNILQPSDPAVINQVNVPSSQNPAEPAQQGQQPQNEKVLKTFTGEEFKNFYNSFAYPNTTEVTSPPSISGNAAADSRMQQLAEARGYRLRSIPNTNLPKYADYYLQEKAYQPWLDLKAAAADAGIRLDVVSGFRSIEEQRSIFMQRLLATGATVEQVAAGRADSSVNLILSTSALPGYSRHHTGYTLDLMCNGQDFNFFKDTVCYEWLSKNNYENAKKFGWIPSYPDGAGQQGPDPEAWEYVWVGVDALY